MYLISKQTGGYEQMLDHTDILTVPGSNGSRFNKVNKGDQRTKLTAVTTNRVSEPRIPRV